MNKLHKLFLVVGVIGPIHMIEQLMTGIDEFYFLKSSLVPYYDLFPLADADRATVLLITIAGAILTAALYAFLVGGKPRLVALGLFGIFGVSEVHHVVESIVRMEYDPGLITSIAYCWFGALLAVAAWNELRRLQASPGTTVPGLAAA